MFTLKTKTEKKNFYSAWVYFLHKQEQTVMSVRSLENLMVSIKDVKQSNRSQHRDTGNTADFNWMTFWECLWRAAVVSQHAPFICLTVFVRLAFRGADVSAHGWMVRSLLVERRPWFSTLLWETSTSKTQDVYLVLGVVLYKSLHIG